jgi:hypothetical protein
VHAVKEQFAAIITAPEELSEDRTVGAEVHGLLTSVSSMSLAFYICVLDAFLEVSRVLSQ